MGFAIAKQLIFLLILCSSFFLPVRSKAPKEYHFVVKEANYTRLCSTKSILTVNGQFPGPVIRTAKGETVYVNVYNKGNSNMTLHWHGVKQPRNPWSDGPEYITQCPIMPGRKFRQKLIFSTEEGTLWWHAHTDDWSRATVHGAIIIYPRHFAYPFPKFDAEVPFIFGEWWKSDVEEIYREFFSSGGSPNDSDAITINGQPGDLFPCSKSGTFRLNVDRGKTYLLRMVNAAMNLILFFGVSKHNLTLVGTDGAYTRPLTKEYIVISPGQSADVLLHANQKPGHYYMAARAYSTGNVPFDRNTTTAILEYNNATSNSIPSLPSLPNYTDTTAAFGFFGSIRGLKSRFFRKVPLNSSTHIVTTLAINALPCPNNSCAGPNGNGSRFAASMTNISFRSPNVDVLEAYYNDIKGVYSDNFPRFPPLIYNFTGDNLPMYLELAKRRTKAVVLNYGVNVELVLQNTNLFNGIDHPIHLHGYSFHVVGLGFGNFNPRKSPSTYNRIDPPLVTTVTVPRNGWITLRFKATNPGVWFMHCHLERHVTWGMATVFIVKDGKNSDQKMLPRPPDMPPC